MKTDHDRRRERRVALVICIALLLVAVITRLALRNVMGFARVRASSMAPTIHKDDRVVVSRLAYLFREPRVGDIASYWTFKRDLFIHRIVGGPGDKLEMRDNVLFRNGERVHEPYIRLTPGVQAVRSFGPVTVPPGHYFFLGDDRDNANDSRFMGFTAEDDIRGSVVYVLHIGECSGP